MLNKKQLPALLCIAFLSACSLTKEGARRQSSPVDTTPVVMEQLLPELEISGADPYDTHTAADTASYRATYKREFDLLHTRLDLRPEWATQHLQGKATLTLKPYFYDQNQLILDAKGFDISRVELSRPYTTPLTYTYDGKKLNIALNKSYTRKDTLTVTITYIAKPNELALQDNYITYDNQGLYFIDPFDTIPNKPRQMWTQGETEASSCWFPTLDNPAERTTQELLVTVDNTYVTLSNGKLIRSTPNADGTRTDYWKQDLPHAPYLFALFVGDFAVVKDQWQGKEVSYYVDPELKPHAKAIFQHTPDMLTFFSKILDYPYPWDKYAQIVVHDFVAGAMENTGAVAFASDVNKTTREVADEHNDCIVAHEMFHHWFGNLVGAESWSNLALNESLANYSEYLWLEHQYGREEADLHAYFDTQSYFEEAREKKVPIVRYYYPDRETMFDLHSYNKGGRVLHVLRTYVGDDAFFSALRLYLKKYAFQPAELAQLRIAFEEVTGEDLNWFFDQWFLQAGHPELLVEYGYDAESQQAKVNISQQQSGKPYKIPTSVAIYFADGSSETHLIVVDQLTQTFSFPVKQQPVLINFDPQKAILCTRADVKTADQYVYLYRFAPAYLDRYEALSTLAQQQSNPSIGDVFIQALSDRFWAIRKKAIDQLNFDQLSADQITSANNKLAQLALNDSHPQVRAAALSLMATRQQAATIPILEKAIARDSSYTVQAVALGLLARLSPAQSLEAAHSLEHENDANLNLIIAQIYAEQGNVAQQVFFKKRLENAAEFELFTVLDFYSQYLLRLNDPQAISQAIPNISNIAAHNSNWWIKLQAMQKLGLIYDKMVATTTAEASPSTDQQQCLQLLEKAIEHIKKEETDTRLLDFYRNMKP